MGSMISTVSLPIFGIIVIALLLDVKFKEVSHRKLLEALLFFVVITILSIFIYVTWGRSVYRVCYPFIIQAPSYILFRILSPYKGVKLLFVLLTAITTASIPVNISVAISTFCRIALHTNSIIFVISCIITLVIIYLFFKPDFNYVLKYGKSKDFYKLCVIPALYYFYSIYTSGYNFIQSVNPDGYFMRRIPDIIVFISYILVVSIFHSTREKQILKNEQFMMISHLETAEQQIAELRNAQEQARIYRHDLRHHFSLIKNLAEKGDIKKIKEYLIQSQNIVDNFTPTRFCANETINLIVSNFSTRAEKSDVSLLVDIDLPPIVPISDIELCALLSNALDNAITAVSEIEDPCLRNIKIICKLHRTKILIFIQNPYKGQVLIENGIPQSSREGHGFGVKSISIISQNHNGYCSFSTNDGLFTLKVVLPLDIG